MKKTILPPQISNNHGQLMAIIPLSIALAVGGIALWGFNRVQRETVTSSRSRTEMDKLASAPIKRLRKLLEIRDAATVGCDALETAMIPFRSLTNDIPAEVELTFDLASATTAVPVYGGVSWSDCLWTPEEKGIAANGGVGPIESLKIEVTRVGLPDLETLSSNVLIRARVRSRSTTQNPGPTRTLNLKEQFTLSAASLFRYALVLRPNLPASPPLQVGAAVATPQIATNLSRINFMGHVFRAGKTAVDLETIVAFDGNTAFNGRLDIQANDVTTTRATLSADLLNQIFRGKFRDGIFNNVVKLPIEDGINANNQQAWQHMIHYRSADGHPRPALPFIEPPPGGVQWTSPYPVPAGTTATVDIASYSNFAIGPFMRWQIFTVPNATFNTCDPNTNSVYVQMDFNRTIEIGTAANGGWGAGITRFCGLIAANEVVIDLAGQNREFFGQIITKKLTVQGGAGSTLTVYNPIDNMIVPSPGTLSQANILRFMQALAGKQAHNFFVPILLNPAQTDTANDQLRRRYYPFRPHGALSQRVNGANSNWANKDVSPEPNNPLGVPPPATLASQPRVGYAFGCREIAANTWSAVCPYLNYTPLTRSEIADMLCTTDASPTAVAPCAAGTGKIDNFLVYQ